MKDLKYSFFQVSTVGNVKKQMWVDKCLLHFLSCVGKYRRGKHLFTTWSFAIAVIYLNEIRSLAVFFSDEVQKMAWITM